MIISEKLLPRFLELPVYAIDISDLSYKYLRLKHTKAGTTVEDFGEGEIPTGIVSAGEIRKKDELAAILREVFIKKNINYVAMSLPEEKSFLRPIKLTGVKEEEIPGSLALQLEEHIPLPPSEVAFDYIVTGREKDHFDIVLNAFPKTFVDSYVETISLAGALPVFVEPEITAALRAIIPQNFKETGMLIDWGKTKTSFAIFDEGALQFTSTVPIGGNALNDAISKALKVDLKRAKELKYQKGFIQTPDSINVFQAIVPIVTSLREEAEKYISYWQTHSEKKKTPSRLFLSGGDANLTGLGDYLSRELKMDCSIADPWANVHFPARYIPDIDFIDSTRYPIAVGLCLGAAKEIKFL